jgi:hypothetical protein
MEDMLTTSGWILYVGLACFLLAAIAWMGNFVCSCCRLTVHAIGVLRRSGQIDRLQSGLELVKGMALLRCICLLFVGLVLIAGLSGCFGELILRQRVQLVRFDRQQCKLVYRWSRFNEEIAYRSIKRVTLEAIPKLSIISGARNGTGSLHIVIETPSRTYMIEAAAHDPERRNANAIYEELKRRSG